MTYSPETENFIAEQTAIRNDKITALKSLYARLCRMQGKPVSWAKFSDQINTKFETTSGIDSLTRDSIQIVKEGLIESISKAERK